VAEVLKQDPKKLSGTQYTQQF